MPPWDRACHVHASDVQYWSRARLINANGILRPSGGGAPTARSLRLQFAIDSFAWVFGAHAHYRVTCFRGHRFQAGRTEAMSFDSRRTRCSAAMKYSETRLCSRTACKISELIRQFVCWPPARMLADEIVP